MFDRVYDGPGVAVLPAIDSQVYAPLPIAEGPQADSDLLGEYREYCVRAASTSRYDLQEKARHLLPDEKSLQGCGRAIRKGIDGQPLPGVTVMVGRKSAFFRGVHQCGSVWGCPVCAAKISEHRKGDVQLAIDAAIGQGFGVSHITLTFRHGLADPLPDMLARFSKALRRFKAGRAAGQLRKDFGLCGEIRALEITHGDNGWHPHTHGLMFSNKPIFKRDRTRLKRRVFCLWYAACKKEGLPLPTYRNGVDVRGAKYAGQYVAKWGFACEITKANLKSGKKGRSPFQILAAAGEGCKRSAWLFREYFYAFKGKRQLFWSRGLKQKLGITDQDMTDQEVLELEPDDDPRPVFVIDPDTWAVVVRAKAQADVLAAARDGPLYLMGLLNDLRLTVPLYNGEILGPRSDWA